MLNQGIFLSARKSCHATFLLISTLLCGRVSVCAAFSRVELQRGFKFASSILVADVEGIFSVASLGSNTGFSSSSSKLKKSLLSANRLSYADSYAESYAVSVSADMSACSPIFVFPKAYDILGMRLLLHLMSLIPFF